LQNLGTAQLALDHSDDGLASLRQAVRIFHSVRERRGEASALMRLGTACSRRGLFAEARDSLDHAHEIFVQLHDNAQADRVHAEIEALAKSQ
jgi:Flp pilus assembly protein TadD